MNETREAPANEPNNGFLWASDNAAESAAQGGAAEADEMQTALMEGFAEGEDSFLEDGLLEENETDLNEDDDSLLGFAAEEGALPAQGAAQEKGAAGRLSGANGSFGANGTDGANSMDGTAGAPEAKAGEAGKAVAAAGTAKEAGSEAAPQSGEEPGYKGEPSGQEQEMPAQMNAAQPEPERNSMPAQLIEQYAAANGMTVQRYLQLAGQSMHRQAVEKLTQKGVPEETAQELVAERTKLAMERRALAPLLQRLNEEEARRKAREPWLEMTREYPNVTQLPERVLQSVQRGERPLAAMRAWELEQMRERLSAQELQLSAQAAALKNRQTTPGSAAGAADAKQDPFLDALLAAD